jgi:hypothetical protein
MSAAESQPDQPPPEEQPEDDLKAQFRAALERKRGKEAEANSTGEGKDKSKVHGAHGPAHAKRSFRRKSG